MYDVPGMVGHREGSVAADMCSSILPVRRVFVDEFRIATQAHASSYSTMATLRRG
jgi:hypothetical protein